MPLLNRITLAVTLWAGACHARDRAATPPRLWVFSGGETGPFCLLLRDDSTGLFYSGFVSHNPVHWRYDRSAHRLDLTLEHLSADDYFVLKDNLARGYFLALDTASGTVSYALNPDAPAINLFNWVLVPVKDLKDWQLRSAREGCPPLGSSGGA